VVPGSGGIEGGGTGTPCARGVRVASGGGVGGEADFFYEPPGCALGDANRLLDGTGTLMADTMFLRDDWPII
jgi:hypothetical protein